jgi:GPH family glycoside/pentoside/hexuronide:cation symporter
MGFNFVANFSYYNTIFYLYGGDTGPATSLLGTNGTAWAVAALLAVFPLNWLSRLLGKHRTLIVAVALMGAAQASKIVCYDPQAPYLVLIPTVLLSSGMLMFFTLASSMIADVCDAEELATGTRSEGVYYSVFWWFLKLGTALASFVGGLLLAYTQFDERLSVETEILQRDVATLSAMFQLAQNGRTPPADLATDLERSLDSIEAQANKLVGVLNERADDASRDAEHLAWLQERLNRVLGHVDALGERVASEDSREPRRADLEELNDAALQLRRQSPRTLFRLRLVEIGLPILLSVVTVVLLFGYPLTEQRCYEIRAELDRRKQPAP